MSDRELLELAAKAAGVEIQNIGFDSGPHYKNSTTRWNPLTNDGDALRLAVKLNMAIKIGNYDVICECQNLGFLGYVAQKIENKEISETTRRAIVRAAADIGKTMP